MSEHRKAAQERRLVVEWWYDHACSACDQTVRIMPAPKVVGFGALAAFFGAMAFAVEVTATGLVFCAVPTGIVLWEITKRVRHPQIR